MIDFNEKYSSIDNNIYYLILNNEINEKCFKNNEIERKNNNALYEIDIIINTINNEFKNVNDYIYHDIDIIFETNIKGQNFEKKHNNLYEDVDKNIKIYNYYSRNKYYDIYLNLIKKLDISLFILNYEILNNNIITKILYLLLIFRKDEIYILKEKIIEILIKKKITNEIINIFFNNSDFDENLINDILKDIYIGFGNNNNLKLNNKNSLLLFNLIINDDNIIKRSINYICNNIICNTEILNMDNDKTNISNIDIINKKKEKKVIKITNFDKIKNN
jgi:hypothetical protein